jgi:hypothetical protein
MIPTGESGITPTGAGATFDEVGTHTISFIITSAGLATLRMEIIQVELGTPTTLSMLYVNGPFYGVQTVTATANTELRIRIHNDWPFSDVTYELAAKVFYEGVAAKMVYKEEEPIAASSSEISMPKVLPPVHVTRFEEEPESTFDPIDWESVEADRREYCKQKPWDFDPTQEPDIPKEYGYGFVTAIDGSLVKVSSLKRRAELIDAGKIRVCGGLFCICNEYNFFGDKDRGLPIVTLSTRNHILGDRKTFDKSLGLNIGSAPIVAAPIRVLGNRSQGFQ